MNRPSSRLPKSKKNPTTAVDGPLSAGSSRHTSQIQFQHHQQVRTIFDPEVLRQYSEMVPDAPERVLRVFELNSETERSTRTTALDAQIKDNRRRDWMAFGIIFGGMVTSAILAAIGTVWLSGATLVGIAAYSVIGFLQKRGPQTKPPAIKQD